MMIAKEKKDITLGLNFNFNHYKNKDNYFKSKILFVPFFLAMRKKDQKNQLVILFQFCSDQFEIKHVQSSMKMKGSF